MQEITGAKPVRDANFNSAPKALSAMHSLRKRIQSFIFETVFSDPVGEKLGFLKQAAQSGYAVILCFVGISGAETSEQRVAMRVSQGGHDVPAEKLVERYPRTLANLAGALHELPCVLIFDNDDLRVPFRHLATCVNGQAVQLNEPVASWLQPLL